MSRPSGVDELSGDGVVTDRQQRDCDVVVPREFLGDFRLGRPLTQSFASIQVRREIAIAQAEPRLATQCFELFHHSPRLAAQPPAQLVVVETREGIGDGVEVGADR